MKNYTSPELEVLSFGADKAIAGWSNIFNDDEFGSW